MNGGKIITPGGDDPMMQQVMQTQMQEQQVRMQAQAMMVQSEAAIFGSLLAAELHARTDSSKPLDPETVRRCAQQAHGYGPYFAEAYGLLQVQTKDESSDG